MIVTACGLFTVLCLWAFVPLARAASPTPTPTPDLDLGCTPTPGAPPWTTQVPVSLVLDYAPTPQPTPPLFTSKQPDMVIDPEGNTRIIWTAADLRGTTQYAGRWHTFMVSYRSDGEWLTTPVLVSYDNGHIMASSAPTDPSVAIFSVPKGGGYEHRVEVAYAFRDKPLRAEKNKEIVISHDVPEQPEKLASEVFPDLDLTPYELRIPENMEVTHVSGVQDDVDSPELFFCEPSSNPGPGEPPEPLLNVLFTRGLLEDPYVSTTIYRHFRDVQGGVDSAVIRAWSVMHKLASEEVSPLVSPTPAVTPLPSPTPTPTPAWPPPTPFVKYGQPCAAALAPGSPEVLAVFTSANPARGLAGLNSARFDGWNTLSQPPTTVGVPRSGEGGQARHPAIAADARGENWYVVYFRTDGENRGTWIAKYNASLAQGWIDGFAHRIAPGPSGDYEPEPSIAIGPDNVIWVAYVREDNNVYVNSMFNGAWRCEEQVTDNGLKPDGLVIRVEPSTLRPQLVFTDLDTSNPDHWRRVLYWSMR
jgi:hypothetical protein